MFTTQGPSAENMERWNIWPPIDPREEEVVFLWHSHDSLLKYERSAFVSLLLPLYSLEHNEVWLYTGLRVWIVFPAQYSSAFIVRSLFIHPAFIHDMLCIVKECFFLNEHERTGRVSPSISVDVILSALNYLIYNILYYNTMLSCLLIRWGCNYIYF